jgi:hypothetical protein
MHMSKRLGVALLAAGAVGAPARGHAGSPELSAQLASLDAALFDAFNACNMSSFAALLTEDLEFYHDKDGFQSKDRVVQSVDAACTQRRKGEIPRIRRELVEGSLRSWPVQDYGAVQAGSHRFHEVVAGGKDKLVGAAEFLHIWKRQPDGWRLARVVSYDHRSAP